MHLKKLIAIASAIGGVVNFFDPLQGAARRAQLQQRLRGLFGSRDAAGPPNDETLAHKVESELFRDPSIPKGSININAEHGTVILRGVVESQDQIERIMLATMAIDGVKVVRSLLRTPAQSTATAFERESEPVVTTSGNGDW